MATSARRRFGLAGLVMLLLAVPAAVRGQAPAQGPPAPPPFAALGEQVLGLFPKVDGDVIEVRGREATLSVGKRDGLQPGLTLSVFRQGRELKHPRTGAVLGRTEEPVGSLVVDNVQEAYATGTLAADAKAAPGDKVRLSAGKVKLTVLPLVSGVRDAQVEVTVRELMEELNRSGRFQVMAGDPLAVWLAEQGIRPEQAIEGRGITAAAAKFGAEHVLAVHLKRIQNRPYMEVRLFSAVAGRPPLLTTALFVPSSVRPEVKAQFSGNPNQRGPAEPRRRSLLARILGGEFEPDTYSAGEGNIPLREIGRFDFAAVSIDVAVAPADKVPRLVLFEGERIYLHKIVGQKIEPEWTFTSRAFGRIVSVQLADLDGDGVLEVVANRWDTKAGLYSFVVSAKSGKPRVIADSHDLLLWAADLKGDGVKQTLWGQRLNQDKFFTPGQAEQLAIKGTSFVVQRPARVHYTFRPTGATFSNINGKDATRVLAFIDDQNRLQIASEGEDLWRSASPVGGGSVIIETYQQIGQGGRSQFFKLEPSPVSIDLDGDGIEEIVVPQNVLREGLLAVVFKGPAGFRLQTVNSGFEGMISGIGGYRLDDSPQPVLIAAVVRFTNILKTAGITQIIMAAPQD